MLKRFPIIYLVMKGWQYAGQYRSAMVWYTIMFAIAQGIALSEPYVIGRLLNSVQTDVAKAHSDTLMHDICVNLGLFFAIQFVFWVFHGPGRVIERFVQFQIKVKYKTTLFKMVTDLPMQWHRDHHSGDSIDKINRATNSLSEFFDSTFEISYMLFRFAGTQVILFFFMPMAGWCSLITTVIALTVILLFDKILSLQYLILNKMDNRVASAIHDYVTNIVSVITLRLEGPVLKEVTKRMTTQLPLFQKNSILNEWKWFITNMLIGAMTVAVLLWYTHKEISTGQMIMTGTFFTLFEYLRRIGDSFYNFAYIYGNVMRQATNVQSADPLVESYEKLKAGTNGYNLPQNWKEVLVDHLNFTYEDEKHRTHHLQDVSILLRRGSSIALVGESGSGKSTLLNLLRGMQNADSVEVVCDGTIMPGKLSHLSQTTTLMPQDPEIFADTIGFNITFGFACDDADLKKAIEFARFTNVLARLPNQLETSIAEKGVNLSGGEKQRLALARGIFFAADSSVVLMDEPTSSVDTYNERLIYEKVLSEFSNKCVISAIHKLHLLEMFDSIYVFEDGRIVEKGSFDELIARNGKLARMWRNYKASENITISETSTVVELTP